jgi:hypothetical protein
MNNLKLSLEEIKKEMDNMKLAPLFKAISIEMLKTVFESVKRKKEKYSKTNI